MDRNIPAYVAVVPAEVALRKESVDRNGWPVPGDSQSAESLSARRAWIEIADVVSVQHGGESLSARRAWIEISR